MHFLAMPNLILFESIENRSFCGNSSQHSKEEHFEDVGLA
jgi:hypothetical protein